MPSPRNIALTVHELEAGEFYWVLLEAVADTPETSDTPAASAGSPHVYVPLEAAVEPCASYSNALVAGVAAMRRLFGPDGTLG